VLFIGGSDVDPGGVVQGELDGVVKRERLGQQGSGQEKEDRQKDDRQYEFMSAYAVP
jgi:hypothetical protein